MEVLLDIVVMSYKIALEAKVYEANLVPKSLYQWSIKAV